MTGLSASAARVRELAALVPPDGMDQAQLLSWYAERTGALAHHALILADEIDRQAAQAARPCGAPCSHGGICSLPPGHAGAHEARGFTGVSYCTWTTP